MANTRAGNVIRVDTSAAFVEAKSICGVKYIGASSGTGSIKADSTSGNLMWEESGTANVSNPELEMYSTGGVYVTVTNGAVVYLYLE